MRPDQFLRSGLAVQRLRHRAIGERKPRHPVPPVVRKLDQIVIDTKVLPALALRLQHGIERGVIHYVGFAVFRQPLAEAISRERLHQFGMARIAVIALAVVFHHELPVGGLDQIVLHRNLQLGHVEDRDLLFDIGLHPVDGRRIVRKTKEDQPADVFQRHRAQAVVGLVEVLWHVARSQQLAVQRKGPLVIGASDARRLARALAQLGAAMRASVVKRTDLALLVAHHDHGGFAELKQELIARVLHVRNRAGIKPHRLEHDLGVEAVGLFAHVEILRQRVAAAGLLQAFGNRVKVHHVRQLRNALLSGSNGESGMITARCGSPRITISSSVPTAACSGATIASARLLPQRQP